MLRTFLLVATFLFSVSTVHAESSGGVGFYVFFPERQKERSHSRWTLGEWLSTKKTIADQNLWLAKHSNKVPIDVTYSIDVRKPGRLGHEIEFFMLWLGLRARFESPWTKISSYFDPLTKDPAAKGGDAGFAIRLVGGNPQNTSLTMKALFEYEHLQGPSAAIVGPYKGWVLEPELQVYLAPWLGARGTYRYRFDRANIVQKTTSQSGNSWWAGAFMEGAGMRIEVGYESRLWKFTNASDSSLVDSFNTDVVFSRLRLFF